MKTKWYSLMSVALYILVIIMILVWEKASSIAFLGRCDVFLMQQKHAKSYI